MSDTKKPNPPIKKGTPVLVTSKPPIKPSTTVNITKNK